MMTEKYNIDKNSFDLFSSHFMTLSHDSIDALKNNGNFDAYALDVQMIVNGVNITIESYNSFLEDVTERMLAQKMREIGADALERKHRDFDALVLKKAQEKFIKMAEKMAEKLVWESDEDDNDSGWRASTGTC